MQNWSLVKQSERLSSKGLLNLFSGYCTGVFTDIGYKKTDAETRARMMLYYQVAEQGIFLSDSKEKRKKLLKQLFAF